MQLVKKGQSIELKSKSDATGPFQATLKWRTAVDLDLHCFYRLKSTDQPPPAPKGFWQKLGAALSSPPSNEGQILFSNMGSRNGHPWISLDEDAGVGDEGGDNEENIHFWDINKVEHALIVANIYNKTTNFGQYSGRVIVKGGGKKFEIPLSETTTGSWCVVARIDNSSGTPKLFNVNQTQSNIPTLDSFI